MAYSFTDGVKPTETECKAALNAVGDALYVIGGKWKLQIIAALRDHGNQRFNELQRSVKGISARVLSNELKQMEQNDFIRRNIYTASPVVVEYELTDYSDTLGPVLRALHNWGSMHRDKIRGKSSTAVPAEELLTATNPT
jgi:DNA-binding HxlR family transcriptional regulator